MKKDVTVLGIHDGHNAGAALIKNGSVVAALQEERLNNIKNYSGAPINAIRTVFDVAQVNPLDVDVISVAGFIHSHTALNERPLHVKLYERYAGLFKHHAVNSLLVKTLQKRRQITELRSIFGEMGVADKPVLFIEHHTAHAASTYYQRPWVDDTLVLTLDGAGDGLCSTVNIGHKYALQRIASTTAYNSPGNMFYSEITGYLGLKRWEHEYKVMGMAPYGISDYCIDEIRKIVRICPNKPLEFENTIGAYVEHVQTKLVRLLAEQRFDNISAATQQHFEDLVVQWVKNAIEHTGLHKIACAGGMFLNVKANKLLREMEEIDDIHFYPAASDEGVAIGAAMEGYYTFCKHEGIIPAKSELGPIYYGKEYSNGYIQNVIKDNGWVKNAQYVDEIDGEIADLLVQNKIVARFNGRDEFGPRGLGNRSILADPRDLKVIRKINFAIKHRDFWMPFAASVLDARKTEYFLDAKFAPYMIEAFDTKPLAEELIAGLHPKDMTCRPQTVNEWNPGYKILLEAFQEHTNVGGMLNTSFNLHGSPMVGTPEVALYTFENSGLDVLAIGNWLITKE